VFVRVDSPTVHVFFSSDRQAASRVSFNAMLRVTLMFHCTTRATITTVKFSKFLIVMSVACCASRCWSQRSVQMTVQRLENGAPIVTRFVLQ